MKKILFIALTLVYGFSYSQSVKLTYNLKKGQNYAYENKMNMDITQEMMGQEINMTTDITTSSKFSVDKVSAKEITFLQTYGETKTHIKSPMFDSTIVSKDLESKTITLIIKPNGEKIQTIMSDSLKAELSGLSGNNRLLKFPDNSINFGEKWKESINDTIDQMGGKINTTSNVEYTLVKKEKKNNHECYQITFTGDMTLSGKFTQMGMEMYLEGKGKISGTIYIDIKTGMIINEEDQTEINSNISVTGQENMIIPMSQKMNTSKTLIEK
jgi:hypothetical protein